MKTVTRAHLAEAAYYAGPGVSRQEAAELVDRTLKEIADALVAGDKVLISRFGTFATRRKGARVGRNPKRPSEETIIPPRVALTFKAALELKHDVAAGRRE